MQRENKWQDRFDEEFLKVGNDRYIVVESYGEAFKETIERIKSFIQSEIDTAIAEERERIDNLTWHYKDNGVDEIEEDTAYVKVSDLKELTGK